MPGTPNTAKQRFLLRHELLTLAVCAAGDDDAAEAGVAKDDFAGIIDDDVAVAE